MVEEDEAGDVPDEVVATTYTKPRMKQKSLGGIVHSEDLNNLLNAIAWMEKDSSHDQRLSWTDVSKTIGWPVEYCEKMGKAIEGKPKLYSKSMVLLNRVGLTMDE